MGDLKDFTLSNARRFYSSKGKNLAAKGLKAKQGQELVKAFQTILASGQKPLKLQTDQRVSMGLTVRRKTAKNLAVRRKNERILAVSRKKN